MPAPPGPPFGTRRSPRQRGRGRTGAADVVVGRGEIGIDFHGFPAMGQPFFDSAAKQQGLPQVVLGQGMIGTQADRLLVLLDGLVESAGGGIGGAQVVVSHRIIGLQRDGHAVVRDGPVDSPTIEKRRRKLAVSLSAGTGASQGAGPKALAVTPERRLMPGTAQQPGEHQRRDRRTRSSSNRWPVPEGWHVPEPRAKGVAGGGATPFAALRVVTPASIRRPIPTSRPGTGRSAASR